MIKLCMNKAKVDIFINHHHIIKRINHLKYIIESGNTFVINFDLVSFVQ